MNALLSIDDVERIDGEPRISDRKLMRAVGYASIGKVHGLIRRHWDDLSAGGEVFSRVVKNPSKLGGRPSLTFYLNEDQAVLLCVFAETEKARPAKILVVKVFNAFRRGELVPAPQPAPEADPFRATAERVAQTAQIVRDLGDMSDLALRVTHLPIWPSRKRPRWWRDVEVRTFLTVSHWQMTTLDAEAKGKALYGARCPGKSAIHVYWCRLEQAVGPVQAARRLS